MKQLIAIQAELKAPKNQFNSFGKYNYRSCEDILEGVKPLLTANKCSLILSDDIVEVGGRIYVKATARLISDNGDIIAESSAMAREAENKKGMDESQITGTASSYARKYALNGLFCIDDTKDADTMDNSKPQAKPSNEHIVDGWKKKLLQTTNIADLQKQWQAIPTNLQTKLEGTKNEMKNRLTK
jgi:hypothetical protein